MDTATRVDQWAFAVALYARLLRRPGNLVFSPHNVRGLLAMAQAGARGETATEIADALVVPDLPRQAMDSITGPAHPDRADGQSVLAIACSLWAQEGQPLRPEFLQAIERQPGAEVHAVDFATDPEAVRTRINQWAEDRTNGIIRNLISPGGLRPDQPLVLAGAIYFKGSWQDPFKVRNTSEQPFHLEIDRSVPATYMRADRHLRHYGGDGFQVVQLMYSNFYVSMYILLPDRMDGLEDLEARLTSGALATWLTSLKPARVQVHLPKFKFSRGEDLGESLGTLGMRRAFSPEEADFSGINGHRSPDPQGLWIGEILHKAFVDVNEEGTEAAAVSASMFAGGTSVQPEEPIVFCADHPFLFVIRDSSTDDLLFLGRVTDPTS